MQLSVMESSQKCVLGTKDVGKINKNENRWEIEKKKKKTRFEDYHFVYTTTIHFGR